ncbi:nucleotide-diphospho-sugar transferase [Chytriomyces cf. hyalinus JEL632]|nr:nucleotide-diphospho-sugar transferase [Chytriomyces cf. hyalinus JEL632]
MTAGSSEIHPINLGPAVLFRIGFTLAMSAVLASPVIIAYALNFKIAGLGFLDFGIYGLVVLIHFCLQTIFALHNRFAMNEAVSSRESDWIGLSCALLIVGYKEDPDLFVRCLESAAKLDYSNNMGIMCVIDGDEKGDQYMADIFSKVFAAQSPVVLTPGFALADVNFENDDDAAKVQQLYHDLERARGRPVCILQTHGGKRHAMYTGFKALLEVAHVESVMVTDSDTDLHPDSMKELSFTLLSSPDVGAVTGDVKIMNPNSWVAFLSSLRYWFAFNIERGAQSFFRCVTCVSGPLGVYRSEVVRQVLEPWVTQTFLWNKCTYGDDRHLTNLTLRTGAKVLYTHHASCLTETPLTFFRWITQQTRWSKSFFREFLFSIPAIHRQSLWMSYELFFQALYPFVLIFAINLVLWKGTLLQLIMWANMVLFIGILKSVVAVILTKDAKFLLFPCYGFMYFFGLLIAKIQALLLLWDVGWGTSSRVGQISSKWKDMIIPSVWIVYVLAAIGYAIYRALNLLEEGFSVTHVAAASFLGGYLLLTVIGYNLRKRTFIKARSDEETLKFIVAK